MIRKTKGEERRVCYVVVVVVVEVEEEQDITKLT